MKRPENVDGMMTDIAEMLSKSLGDGFLSAKIEGCFFAALIVPSKEQAKELHKKYGTEDGKEQAILVGSNAGCGFFAASLSIVKSGEPFSQAIRFSKELGKALELALLGKEAFTDVETPRNVQPPGTDAQ